MALAARGNGLQIPVTIPDIDETTIRAIAVQAASTLKNANVLEMLGNADVIQEYIDPLQCEDGEEIILTLEKKP